MSDENREIVLSPGEYAYMQDLTKGVVKTYVGPCVINQTGQEKPVVYKAKNGSFQKVTRLEEAVRKSPVAVEGYYLVLKNPAEGTAEEHPEAGLAGKVAPGLEIGRKVNIPGPTMFALWPGQDAQYIRGHHLRSNQYLLVRVYNEEEARNNWTKAVVKRAADSEVSEESSVTDDVPKDLTVGKLFVIKGTEVSFYIPPTGVGVVPEADNQGKLHYVRSALTLERLEYCILIDENGNKRYERGPAVVFPEPTEKFWTSSSTGGKDYRIFKPIELNEIQGIHVKVIADYTDSDGTLHKEGEELFITGTQQKIYFPRQEHAIIKYDGRSKHYATAVPAGEARYLMDRKTGDIEVVEGPTMLLPNPIDSVIVRRVLSDQECRLWYPGNREALKYNQNLRGVTQKPSAESSMDFAVSSALPAQEGRRSSLRSKAMVMADELQRGSTYTEPRSLTLDTKYAGVPGINIFTGYAVLITSKTGKRRVEVGPKSILVGYNETLEVLKLSTGKPKNTDYLFENVYLRVTNNQVGDIVTVKTSDHVDVTIKVSMWIDFVGEDKEKWFSVENYVKFVSDRVRSILKARIREIPVRDLLQKGEDITRQLVLGSSSKNPEGMYFDENGMHLKNMEVLSITINDSRIAEMLEEAQFDAVAHAVKVTQAEQGLTITRKLEEISKEKLLVEHEAQKLKMESARSLQEAKNQALVSDIQEEAMVSEARLKAKEAALQINTLSLDIDLENQKKQSDQNLQVREQEQALYAQRLEAETGSVIARFQAASGGFTEAVTHMTNRETLVKVAQAMSIQRIIGGDSLTDVVGKIFDKTPLSPLIEKVLNKAALPPHQD